MFNKKQALFLAISAKENSVLRCIQKKSSTIFGISKKTKIPRATIYLIIKKLYRRNLIKAKMVSGRYVYKSINMNDLKQLLVTLGI